MDDEVRELYQEVILDHGKNPRNFGQLEDANCEAQGNNPLCGDRLTVYLKIDDDRLISDATFEGKGGAISMASASMMTQMVCGKTVSLVKNLFDKFHKLCTGEIEEFPEEEFSDDVDKLRVMSGVRQFPMRVKCATLGWHTMNAAVSGDSETTTE